MNVARAAVRPSPLTPLTASQVKAAKWGGGLVAVGFVAFFGGLLAEQAIVMLAAVLPFLTGLVLHGPRRRFARRERVIEQMNRPSAAPTINARLVVSFALAILLGVSMVQLLGK